MTRACFAPWRALCGACCLAALGCAAPADVEHIAGEGAAVFGGTEAPDDTNVIAVVNIAGGQCTGSLISPELVMTARHCVAKTAGKEEAVVCNSTKFNPPDSAGAIFVVPLPTITEDPKDYLGVAEIRMPAGSSDELCGTDVVLLRLKKPLISSPTLAPRLDPPVTSSERYSSVGYGIDASLADKPSGVRKRRDELEVTCSGLACKDPGVRANEWVGSGGPCSGDSGGPALDANGQIIGVVSRGKTGCVEPVFSDVASRADWLQAEAVRAANLADDRPPSWAPCSDANPCNPAGASATDAGSAPAETCALSRRPTSASASSAFGWLVVVGGSVFFGRRRRRWA